MGQYTGTNQWSNDIYQFDETDVVQGGPGGIDNRPLKELADRTTYLRARIGLFTHFAGNVDKTGNTTYTVNDEGYYVTAVATGVNTLTIADASTLTHGAIIPITSYCNANCVMNIAASSGQLFYDTAGWRSKMYMHHREHLILVALTDHFRVVHASGNFYCAGEEIKSRKTLTNTLAMQGQLLQRNQYPRLWEYISSFTLGQEVISDSTWLSAGRPYQGFFTNGDGSTTFRLPDERGLFERMMDGGRGVDLLRLQNVPGGYENDSLGPISIYPTIWTGTGVGRGGLNADGIGFLGTNGDGGWVSGSGNYGVNRSNARTSPLTGGGTETTVKNIGKLNLIKF